MKIATMTTLCNSARDRVEKTSVLEVVRRLRAIAKLKDRICAVHIHDNNGKDDPHLPPFIGTVVWEEVMPALRQANYKGCPNYEIGVNRTVPDLLRDEMAKYCFKAGEYLMKMFEETAG